MYIDERIRSVGLIIGILLMVIGIIFLVIPDRIAEFLAVFIGAIITVLGAFGLIMVVSNWRLLLNRALPLIIAIVMLVAGILMLSNPDITITIVGAIIGVFAILLAVERFTTAGRLRGRANITYLVVSGLIHLVFGVGMIYSAVIVFSIIIILMGIYLLIVGIMFAASATAGGPGGRGF